MPSIGPSCDEIVIILAWTLQLSMALMLDDRLQLTLFMLRVQAESTNGDCSKCGAEKAELRTQIDQVSNFQQVLFITNKL
jgi:hypothetical protein